LAIFFIGFVTRFVVNYYLGINVFGNVLSMNNPGQGGAQQGGANPGGNVALGQGFQYDPVTGQYLIQDPNNTAAAPFNSPGTKQPYGRHLANALQHD
jgi:hypothetical protein